MSEQTLLLPADISVDNLEQLFNDAYLNVQKNDDGELFIHERYKFWVAPVNDGKRIQLFAVFGLSETSTFLDRLEYVNLVNDEMSLIRAYLSRSSKNTLLFDYYFSVEGGVSKRALVFAVKAFASALEAALRLDAGDVVA